MEQEHKDITDRQIYETSIGLVCMSKTEYAMYQEEMEKRVGNLHIYVDADACPVVRIVEKIAEKYTVLLEKIFPEENYKVLPGNTIRIYKPHETAESFSRLAAKNDVYITKMQTLQTSLEDYYMELKKRGAVKC